MSNISRIYSEQPVSACVNDSLNEFCEVVMAAIKKVKAEGVPQGLLVAVLAAHFQEETNRLLIARDSQD